MNAEFIEKISTTIQKFNKDKNVNVDFLVSPAGETILIGVYGTKESLEPLKQDLINYISSIDSMITLRGTTFESQDYNGIKEIMYFFSCWLDIIEKTAVL